MVFLADDELASDPDAQSYVDQLVGESTSLSAKQRALAPGEVGPLAPPGLAGPHGHPEPRALTPSRPAAIAPAIPKAPPPPPIDRGTVTPEQTPRKAAGGPDARSKGKAAATNRGAAKSNQSEPSQSRRQQRSGLSVEEYPTLAVAAAIPKQTGSPAIPLVPTPHGTPAPRKAERAKMSEKPPQKASDKAPEAASGTSAPVSKSAGRRAGAAHSGSRAPSASVEDGARPEESAKPPTRPAAPPPSVERITSPAPQSGPRTIRVVPTARIDGSSQPSPVPTALSKAVSASTWPDTPVSEMVSDTASMVSASVTASRAGSPPPNRIGSATVRTSTKSSQRKERKKVMKEETKTIVEYPKPEPEEHAPIMGRKKKQKKETSAKAPVVHHQGDSSAVEATSDVASGTKDSQKENSVDEKARDDVEPKAKPQIPKKGDKGKAREKETKKEPVAEPQPQPEPEPEPQQAEQEKSYLSPAAIFQELRNQVWKTAIGGLQLLKPVGNGSSRQDHGGSNGPANKSGYCKDCTCKCGEINEDDLTALRAGKPVRKQFHVDGSRMLITPNGDCVRSLTTKEEEAFLELQAAIAETAENPGAFVAPRHQPGSGAFSLIKGRAVPNGRPNIFPVSTQLQAQDPIGKLQREDALSYINQYVLPRLNLGASNMGLPKGASPARDSAAASLNSLAPYFYGPDAAAGVGIYSAPEGARAMQDFAAPGVAHIDDGVKVPGGGGVGGMPLMGVEDAEKALAAARKETDKLEKGLNAVIKRNRRLMLGPGN